MDRKSFDMKKVCFYANVDLAKIKQVEFYRTDLSILKDLGFDVVIATSLWEVFKSRNCDLFYVWWWNRAIFVKIIAYIFGDSRVVVCGVIDYFFPYKSSSAFIFRPLWQKILIRLSLKFCDENILICNYEYNISRSFFSIRSPRMVYLAIDETYVSKQPYAETLTALNIAWSSKESVKRKGLVELIQAVKLVVEEYPNFKLVMAGRSGDAVEELRAIIGANDLQKSITIESDITGERKKELLGQVDLYVQPSQYEGFGVAVAEAMRAGVPSLTTAAGSLPEVTNCFLPPITQVAADEIAIRIIEFYNKTFEMRKNISIQSVNHVASKFSYATRRSSLAELIGTGC